MDPEGRIRTDISVVDSDALCHLSYPGVVLQILRALVYRRKTLFRPCP